MSSLSQGCYLDKGVYISKQGVLHPMKRYIGIHGQLVGEGVCVCVRACVYTCMLDKSLDVITRAICERS